MKINYLCVPIGKTLIYPRLLKLHDVMKLIIRKEAIPRYFYLENRFSYSIIEYKKLEKLKT